MSHFSVNSSHKSFNDKQKSLFDELDKVKKSLPCETSMEIDQIRELSSDREETRSFKGQKSLFKRPEAPIRRCLPVRRAPDHQINPHKWTKYNLSDVPEMSERANKTAALSFLKELEARNDTNRSEKECNDKESTVVKFNKSALVKVPDEGDLEGKSTFRSSKVVMAEYVIGQKVKKEKKNREKRSGNSAKSLTLSHLTEEDDDDNNIT